MFSSLDGVVLAQVFGREQIGAIAGLNRGVVAVAQALGPAAFGAVRCRTGSYRPVLWGLALSSAITALLVFLTPRPGCPLRSSTAVEPDNGP